MTVPLENGRLLRLEIRACRRTAKTNRTPGPTPGAALLHTLVWNVSRKCVGNVESNQNLRASATMVCRSIGALMTQESPISRL